MLQIDCFLSYTADDVILMTDIFSLIKIYFLITKRKRCIYLHNRLQNSLLLFPPQNLFFKLRVRAFLSCERGTGCFTICLYMNAQSSLKEIKKSFSFA